MISSFTSFAKDLLQENDKPSYGCLMAMVSPDLSGQFIEWSFDNIDPEDTAPDGYEREPHITVLYGFHPDVTHEEVFTIVRNCKPLKITLGKVTKFKHDDQDVLKVDIESQDLRDLNALIIKSFVDRYTNKYPEYHPHMTLAYVKKGAAEDIDPEVFEGFEMVIDDLVYSYPEESKKVHIKLTEQPEEPIVKEGVYGDKEGYDFYEPSITPKPKEYVVASAIKNIKTGNIYVGYDHYNAYEHVTPRLTGLQIRKLQMGDHSIFIEGFYTNKGHFLTRQDALILTKRNKQTKNIIDPNHLDSMDFSKEFSSVETDKEDTRAKTTLKEDAQKHTYEVKDVFVNGKRYTGHVVTTSEGSALAKIVFRNLSKDQQNNPQPHILTAKQIGGYKIIDRGVFSTPAATTISDPWRDILY